MSKGLVNKTFLVAIAVGLGIGANLLREIVLASSFGVNREIELFRLAVAVPYGLGNVICVSVISIVLAYIRDAETKGQNDDAASIVLYMGIILGLSAGSVNYMTASWQAAYLAKGYSAIEREYIEQHIRLLTFLPILLISSAYYRSMLAHNGSSFLSAISNFIFHGAIVVILTAISIFGILKSAEQLVTTYSLAVVVLFVFLLVSNGYSDANKYLKLDFFRVANRPLVKRLISSIAVLVLFRVLNLVPRFIDRSLFSEFAIGSVAALEYSFGIITVISTLVFSMFLYVLLPRYLRAHGKPAFLVKSLSWLTLFSVVLIFLFFITVTVITKWYWMPSENSYKSWALIWSVARLHFIGVPIMITSMVLSTVLIIEKRYLECIYCVCAKLVLKVVMVYQPWLDLKLVGVLWTFVITEAVLAVLLGYCFYRFVVANEELSG